MVCPPSSLQPLVAARNLAVEGIQSQRWVMEKHHPVNWEVHWKPSFFLFCSSCLKLLTQLHGSRLSKCHDSRHLVNFLGTDTVASMICARDYYGAKKARGLITPKQTSHGCWLLEFIEEIILRIYRYYDEFACRSSSLSCFFFRGSQ